MKKILLFALLFIAGCLAADCELGKIPINNTCVAIVYQEGCASYKNDAQCEICEYGYEKDQNGACILNEKANSNLCCAERDLNGFCSKCAQGLYLENFKCKRNTINGCVVKSGPTCKACGRGYILANNKCIKTILGCEQYNMMGLCTKCTSTIFKQNGSQFSFNLFNGICLKLKLRLEEVTNFVTKCRFRNAYGCIQCQKDFYLGQDRQCYPYEAGCLVYYKGRCIQCSVYRGFELDQNGKCINRYLLLNQPYCAEFQGVRCVACKGGYRLVNEQCVDEKSLQIKIKKECAPGYYLGSDYVCKQSTGNLIKETEETVQQIVSIKQPGCIYQYGRCQYCQAPFQKIDGKCTIPNCKELQQTKTKTDLTYSCLTCRYPYQLQKGICLIPYCSKYQGNRCALCDVGYHLKAGENCVKNDVNCLSYDEDGNCNQCSEKYFISSVGECMLKQSNCLTQQISANNMPICTSCKDGFFLNRHSQCQKMDPNCDVYVNGVCKQCKTRYFLHEFICFPYSVGCVQYSGKDCTQCKKGYTLFNGECYSLKSLGMKLEGEDDQYDFDIYPMDITKSKYYIDNLSPVSELGEFFYSSVYSSQYTNPLLTFEDQYYDNVKTRSKGWKALTNEKGHYVGYKLKQGEEPVTFYALQLEFIEKSEIKSFYLEYTKDGSKWIRVENRFIVSQYLNSDSPQYLKQNGIITVYFTGVYAQAIRIVVDEFVGWPACRIQFFYYDMLRFRKISNLKSLKYLRESIQSNYVDRLDNQLYINQKYFFEPQFECHSGEEISCFTGLELCETKKVSQIELVNQNKVKNGLKSYVSEFYVVYSLTGRKLECYKNCTKFQVDQKDLVTKGAYQNYRFSLGDLQAKNVRIYPTKWIGTPKLSIFFDYN